MRKPIVLVVILLLAIAASADRKKAAEATAKAQHEIQIGNLPKAEKLLREAVQQDPTYASANRLLGDVLSLEHKYGAASDAYAAALKNDPNGMLTDEEKRQVTDQLGVSTALGGNLPKAKTIFEEAIKADPDYPLYRYNLACTYAEMDALDTALQHLREAWKRRKNLPEGERFPDPRQDSSFKRFVNDRRFQDAIRDMVF
jgi:tetratricopeptide (TPR) repeat protein